MKSTRNKLSTAVRALVKPGSGWQTAALVAAAAGAYLFRARQYFFTPQLFAEDGTLWLAEGHNKNFFAVFQTVNGFLHFPERLFGFIVAHLSLQLAPFIFVTAAWAFFILLAYYLLSPRTKILKGNFERLFMVACLALISNIEIFYFNFSNSVFFMGIIAALILVAERPRNAVIDWAEKIFFLLSCLTLPFSWFLLPITLYERFKHKRKDLFFLAASVLGAVVEVVYYLTSHVNRSPITLVSLWSKWTVLEFYNQMLIPAIRFARVDVTVLDYDLHRYQVLMVYLVVIAFLLATFIVLKKSNKQLRYLIFFLAAMAFGSVKSPTLTIALPIDALKTMSIVTGAGRYFIYGILAVNVIFIKTIAGALVPRARYAFMVVFLSFGLISALHYKSFYVEKNFNDYSAQYRHSIDQFESGQVRNVDIPVNPAPWHMLLSK